MTTICILEFDDAQKAAITAGLWAAAQELDDPPRAECETLPSGDDEVIELLSDSSENEEDCEIHKISSEANKDNIINHVYLSNQIQELGINNVNVTTPVSPAMVGWATDRMEMKTDTEICSSDMIVANANSAMDTNRTAFTFESIDVLIQFLCPECNIDCGSKKHWSEHLDSEHNYGAISKLNIESIIEKNGKLCYQCKDCKKRFTTRIPFSTILQHRITHLPYPEYVLCRLCQMRFSNPFRVRYHLLHKHGKICKRYSTQTPTAFYAIRYYCPLCNEEQKSHKSWEEHLEKYHDYSSYLKEKMKFLSNDIIICGVCDKRFRRSNLLIHALKHEKYKGFKCNHCDFETSTLHLCTKHIRVTHLQKGKYKYSCKYCDETFDRIGDKKRHLANKHIVEKPGCEVCNKKFASVALLLSHISLYNHRS